MSVSKLLSKPKLLIAIGGVLAVLVVIAVVYFGTLSSKRTEGFHLENALEARYQDGQNKRSNYVMAIKEELGVADRKTDRLDAVLQAAVSGRYDNDLAAATPGQAPQMISAIVEAYPDLAQMDSYDRIITAVAAGRAEFRNHQSVLLDQIAAYESWLDKGLWHSFMVRRAGFPSNRLEARIGDQVARGEDALEQMKRIVIDSGTAQDFTTGLAEPLDLNPSRGDN